MTSTGAPDYHFRVNGTDFFPIGWYNTLTPDEPYVGLVERGHPNSNRLVTLYNSIKVVDSTHAIIRVITNPEFFADYKNMSGGKLDPLNFVSVQSNYYTADAIAWDTEGSDIAVSDIDDDGILEIIFAGI